MKSQSSASKANRHADRATQHDASAGESAVALAPPAYGIDFVDEGLVADAAAPVQRMRPSSANGIGMPEELKAGIESLSGIDMSDVRIHANSNKPAQLNALAYAQGNDIHVAPGQEKHVPHEAWHLAQQRQGRVPPTSHAKGVRINDDERLEKEADVMGHAAASLNSGLTDRGESERSAAVEGRSRPAVERSDSPIQRKVEAPQVPAPAEQKGASRPADPGVGEGIDVTFILTSALGDEQPQKDFIEGMTSYVKNVLRADNVFDVKGLKEMFEMLDDQGKYGNKKVRRIRIVGHGFEKEHGGEVLTRDLETKTRKGMKSTLITPTQVREFAKMPENRDTITRVMQPGAVVEFWGCNLGNYPEARGAWADLFQSTFVATTEKVAARFFSYSLKGPDGERRARSSKEVDRAGPRVTADFNQFLLRTYKKLVDTGEIAEVSDDPRANVAHMRDMFDRSSGEINFMAVQEAKGQRRYITPDKSEAWNAAWVAFPPMPLEALANENAPAPAEDKPAPTPVSPQLPVGPEAASPGATPPSEIREAAPIPTVPELPVPSQSKDQSEAEFLLKDENVRFLLNVGHASFKASDAIAAQDKERASFLNRLGWSLTLGFRAALAQGRVTPGKAAEMAELWATKLNLFDSSKSPQTISLLGSALLKLNLADLKRLYDPAAGLAQPTREPKGKTPRSRRDLAEEKIDEALAKISQEDISRLDDIQRVWDTISGSNTQQVVNYALEKIANKLTRRLPKTSFAMDKVSKLWTLRHAGTLFLDVLVVADEDRRSARRLMFLDTKDTIDLYNLLPAKEQRTKRAIELVSRGGGAHFEERGGWATLLPSDRITGLTLEKFATLFLTNKEDALTLAEVVGAYVWRYSPRMGTPAGKEAVRRIEEGLKLVRDGVSAALDVYALYNPVWNVMQTVIAAGELLRGNP